MLITTFKARPIAILAILTCLGSGTLIACGRDNAPTTPKVAEGAHGADNAGEAEEAAGEEEGGPAINWDAPLPQGLAVAQATNKSATLTVDQSAAAQRAGGLKFRPVQPGFSRGPVLVQVTDPASTQANIPAVAYVYNFPVGTDFPTDGRVRVLQYQTDVTEADLEAVATNPPGPPEDFKVITVNGHGALLVQNDGIGRVQFVRDGVMYDVTGPAVSPQVVQKLAATL